MIHMKIGSLKSRKRLTKRTCTINSAPVKSTVPSKNIKKN